MGGKLLGMRRPVFRRPTEEAVALFAAAHHVHLASTTPGGAPVLKTLHAVVDEGALFFHAAPVGEKLEVVGRPAVVTAVEVVAQIPSYFTDPERACPATTLYRSAQAHGVIEEVTDPERKASALRRLMEKLQPEGGYAPLAAGSPLYQKAIAGLFVGRLSLDRVDGKAKLCQHKRPAERAKIVEALFRRGEPGDCRAIEAILAASAEDPPPPLLAGPRGSRFCLAPSPEDAAASARLLAGTYWNDRFDERALTEAQIGSQAFVVLRDAAGEVVASARAISDGVKHAWVYDVIVAPGWRGSGAGTALMRLLLDHPAIRRARLVHLGTRDAVRFYERLGFVESTKIARPYRSTTMTFDRRGTGESDRLSG